MPILPAARLEFLTVGGIIGRRIKLPRSPVPSNGLAAQDLQSALEVCMAGGGFTWRYRARSRR